MNAVNKKGAKGVSESAEGLSPISGKTMADPAPDPAPDQVDPDHNEEPRKKRKGIEKAQSADKPRMRKANNESEWRVEETTQALVSLNKTLYDQIAERKQVEEGLRKCENEVQTIVDNLPDMITRSDLDLRCIFVSPRVDHFFGTQQKELLGRTPRETDLFDNATLDRLEALSHNVVKTGEARTFEFTHTLPSGTRHFSTRIVPEFDGRGNVTGLLNVTRDVTELKRTEDTLRASQSALFRSERRRRELAGKLLAAEEEERRRVARELHDEFTQRLAALAIEAGTLEQELVATSAATGGKIKDFKNKIAQLSSDVHRLSRRLHPSILDDLGLIKAIEAECLYLLQTEGVAVRFVRRKVPESVSADIALSLYRIVQESLKNILKHARTKKAYILLVGRQSGIRLSIHDEGIGFDPAQAKGKGGLGLASMEERVRIINGTISIESELNYGTSITVQVPIAPRT